MHNEFRAELDGAGVSQTHLFQQARQGRPLRGVGTAGALHDRNARRLQIAAVERRNAAGTVRIKSSAETQTCKQNAKKPRKRSSKQLSTLTL